MKLHFIYAFIAATILSSCGANGTTEKERFIKNGSSDTIYVEATIPKKTPFNDTILPGATKSLYESTSFGSYSNADIPYDGIAKLIIKSDENVTCKRDYQNETNWIINITKTSDNPEDYSHTYTYTVFDSDF